MEDEYGSLFRMRASDSDFAGVARINFRDAGGLFSPPSISYKFPRRCARGRCVAAESGVGSAISRLYGREELWPDGRSQSFLSRLIVL